MDFGNSADNYPRAGTDTDGTPVIFLRPPAVPAADGADVLAMVAEGLCRRQIAFRLRCRHTENIDRLLRRSGVDPASVPMFPPADALNNAVTVDRLTDSQIAEHFGITQTDARRARVQYGIAAAVQVKHETRPAISKPTEDEIADFVAAGLGVLTPPENDPRADRVGIRVVIGPGAGAAAMFSGCSSSMHGYNSW